MKYYKLNKNAVSPVYATEKSAGIDISPFFQAGDKIRCYNPHNREMELPVRVDGAGKVYAQILPDFRALLPTGLVFNISSDKYLAINVRSSMALKYGISLANQTAIIDEDYVEETFIMVQNTGDTPVQIYSGQRIAQITIHDRNHEILEETDAPVEQKTDRVGGLGSTGENSLSEPIEKKRPGRPKKIA
jgi:dUTP pyrophosphatase